jgi:glucose-1-phosphate thymidylyltransferase
MKGIILAAGDGKRLYPLTSLYNKQLLPVYDKPMIYYPLTTLIENGVTDICIIVKPLQLESFKGLLGDGSRFGISISYETQEIPRGIAEAFIIAEKFINKSNVALILGDNILHGAKIFEKAVRNFQSGANVFGYKVSDPERYGVVEFNSDGKVISIEEKPKNPKSNYAIPGMYLFDNKVVEISAALEPSARGELEITDVIKSYLNIGELNVHLIDKGCAWLDAGTTTAFHDSASYVQAIERRQGIKIGCPEEAAFKRRLLSYAQLKEVIGATPSSEYKDYLLKLL